MRALLTAVAVVAIAGTAFARPVVFWASDPVAPDDTVLVCGDGFTDAPTVTLVHLEDVEPGPPGARAYGAPVAGTPVEVLQPTDQSLKFVIPADMEPGASRRRGKPQTSCA